MKALLAKVKVIFDKAMTMLCQGTIIKAAGDDDSFDLVNRSLPEFPPGDVVGPCICGSWPGGKCFRCPLIKKETS